MVTEEPHRSAYHLSILSASLLGHDKASPQWLLPEASKEQRPLILSAMLICHLAQLKS